LHLQQTYRVTHLRFADHFNFTPEKIDEIHGKFDTFERQKTIIVTTEKDFMRFINSPLQAQISSYPWYVQPIGISIDREEEFLQIVHQYVR
jgi:tetraacyldisaccharide 4'-kinase